MKITNNSNYDITEIKTMLEDFYPFAKKRLNFQEDLQVIFQSDPENGKMALGKTAYYEPARMAELCLPTIGTPKTL